MYMMEIKNALDTKRKDGQNGCDACCVGNKGQLENIFSTDCLDLSQSLDNSVTELNALKCQNQGRREHVLQDENMSITLNIKC